MKDLMMKSRALYQKHRIWFNLGAIAILAPRADHQTSGLCLEERSASVMKDLMMKSRALYQKHRIWFNLGAIAILALIPLVVRQSYYMGILCRILLYATLAGSLNAINGYSGQTCIGHAGFFCIGAYCEAILATRLGLSFWMVLPIAGIVTAIFGGVVALPTLKMKGIYLSIVTLGFSEIVRLVALNWEGLTGGGIVTAIFGGVVALPTLKMKGIYLSIVTLGFSEIVRLVALNWEGLTGGPMGIKGIPVPTIFGLQFSGSKTYYYIFLAVAVLFVFITGRVIRSRVGPMGIKGIPVPTIFGLQFSGSKTYYYIFLAVAVLFVFITGRVIRSRVGRAWTAIREDELAAKSLGVQTRFYKATNFMYGAFWAGIAGAAYAPYVRFIDSTVQTRFYKATNFMYGAFWAGIAGAAYAPYVRFIDSTMFSLDEGFNILSMVIIGGQGTLVGPVVGSVIVNLLTELLRPVGQWRMVAYGLLIILMMWWRPQGLVGASDSILAGNTGKKRMGRGNKKGAAA